VDEHRPKDRGQYATEGYPDEGQGGARSDDWQAGIPPLRARLPTKQACHRGVTLTWPGHGGSRDNTVEHPSPPPVVSRPACPSRRPIPNPASVHRGSRRRLWVTLPRVPRPGRATYHTAWTGPRQAGGEERGPGDPRGTSWRMASPPGPLRDTPGRPSSRGCPGGPSEGAKPSHARKPPASHHAGAWPALCASCTPGSAPGPVAVLPTSSANPDAKPYGVSSPLGMPSSLLPPLPPFFRNPVYCPYVAAQLSSAV